MKNKTTKELITIEVTAEITYESYLGRESAIENALQLNPSTVGCVVGGSYAHKIKERKLISQTETDNTTILLEIKSIVNRWQGLTSVFDLSFKDSKLRLLIVDTQTFITENNENKTIKNLKSGDKIWVDKNDLYKPKIKK